MKHEAPHSPQRRRERLNLRMKSLSLDSPEGTAHVRHRTREYHPGQKESTPPRHSDSGSINRLCMYLINNQNEKLHCQKKLQNIQYYNI